MMQGIVTAILLVAFIGGVVWLFLPRHAGVFDAAARLPLDEEGRAPRNAGTQTDRHPENRSQG